MGPRVVDLTRDYRDYSVVLSVNTAPRSGFIVMIPSEGADFRVAVQARPQVDESLFQDDLLCQVRDVWENHSTAMGRTRAALIFVGSRNFKTGQCLISTRVGDRHAMLRFDFK